MGEQAAEEKKVADEVQAKTDKFWADLEASSDPYDNLGALAQFCQDKVKSTGVYIGELEHPFHKIREDDDENAHFNPDEKEIIKFKFASNDHKDIVGKTLAPGVGVTHDVFNQDTENANSDLEAAAKDG